MAAIQQQQAQHLDHEQRVAFGALRDRLDRVGRQLRAAARGDQAFGLLAIEAVQMHARAARCAQQVGQGLRQGMLARQFGVTQGAEHDDALACQLFGEKPQQAQRARIGPVQVVQDQQQRPQRGQSAPQVRHRHEQAKARLVAVDGGQGGQARPEVLRQAGHDLDRRGRGAAEVGAELRRVECAQRRFERPRPGQEGRRAGFLRTPAPQRQHALLFGHGRGLLREAGLADPRLAGQHEPGFTAVEAACDGLAQQAELGLAPDQLVVGVNRHRRGQLHRGIVGARCGSGEP